MRRCAISTWTARHASWGVHECSVCPFFSLFFCFYLFFPPSHPPLSLFFLSLRVKGSTLAARDLPRARRGVKVFERIMTGESNSTVPLRICTFGNADVKMKGTWWDRLVMVVRSFVLFRPPSSTSQYVIVSFVRRPRLQI